MRFKNSIIYLVFISFLSIAAISCGSEPKTKDESPDKITFAEENNYPDNKLQQDNAKVKKKFGAYTYVVDLEDVEVALVKANELVPDTPAKAVKTANRDNEVPEKVDLLETEVEYTDEELPQVKVDLLAVVKDLELNRPPLFGKDCMGTEKPNKCSNESIEEFVKNNLDYPEGAAEQGHDGLEIAVFRVTEEGNVEDIKIKRKEIPCQGCARAARAVVASTSGRWIPALRNGKPVKTKVTLPIRLETIK